MVLNKTHRKNLQSGLTLVEMIVVCAIVGLISATVMFNYSDFRQGIDTRNLAEETALTIRKAQTYATSSRKIYTSNDDAMTPDNSIRSFGIVFSTNAAPIEAYYPYAKGFTIYAALPTTSDPNSPKYFYDTSGTCSPTTGFGIMQNSECLEYFSITNAAHISNLEVYTSSGWQSLASGINLNIIFHRPTPDADICAISGGSGCMSGVSAARITIVSENGKIQKTVTVWNTGQIAVDSVVQSATNTGGLDCQINDPRIECANNNLSDGNNGCLKKGGC